VDLYGEVEADSVEEDGTSSGTDDVSVTDESEDVLEVDTEALFEEISQGKDYCTLDDIKGWDLIKQVYLFTIFIPIETQILCY
jgi:hypothetical protein